MHGLIGWRLSKRKYAEAALTGEGPRLYGGRWNSVGVPVVYTSLSLSLAVLEVFVPMQTAAEPDDYVYVSVDLGIKERRAERLDLERLPPDWKRVEHPDVKVIGDEWASSLRSPVLLVPSVVVEGEWNALINPLHPGSRSLKPKGPKPYRFDERMFLGRF